MILCNNKMSGKAFIYLEERGNESALLITPQGEIKVLELTLFSNIREELNESHLVDHGQINSAQWDSYQKYKEQV